MSTPRYTDWRHDALVELEDIGRRVRALKEQITADIQRQDDVFAAIMAEVEKERTAAASSGQDCGILNPPNDAPVAPGFECRTHAFAAIRNCGCMATDGDDPPSRTP